MKLCASPSGALRGDRTAPLGVSAPPAQAANTSMSWAGKARATASQAAREALACGVAAAQHDRRPQRAGAAPKGHECPGGGVGRCGASQWHLCGHQVLRLQTRQQVRKRSTHAPIRSTAATLAAAPVAAALAVRRGGTPCLRPHVWRLWRPGAWLGAGGRRGGCRRGADAIFGRLLRRNAFHLKLLAEANAVAAQLVSRGCHLGRAEPVNARPWHVRLKWQQSLARRVTECCSTRHTISALTRCTSAITGQTSVRQRPARPTMPGAPHPAASAGAASQAGPVSTPPPPPTPTHKHTCAPVQRAMRSRSSGFTLSTKEMSRASSSSWAYLQQGRKENRGASCSAGCDTDTTRR